MYCTTQKLQIDKGKLKCIIQFLIVPTRHALSLLILTIPIVKNLSSVIKLGKDSTKQMDRTNVVYKIRCKDCEACYIGETKRTLKTRIKEHINNKNNESVVWQHQINFRHEFDWNRTPSTKGHTEPYRKKVCMEKVGYCHVRFQQIHTDLTFLYVCVWNFQQKIFWFVMASVWICNSFWGMPHWTLRTPRSVWFCMKVPTEYNLDSV